MIRLLSRLLVLGILLAALYIILSPAIFKNVRANLTSQVNASSTVISQLQTPVAAITTPVQAAVNPTVVATTTSTPATPVSSNNTSSDANSALTYSNGNNLFKKLMSQFPDTGVVPPKGSSYDNYTFPRKY